VLFRSARDGYMLKDSKLYNRTDERRRERLRLPMPVRRGTFFFSTDAKQDRVLNPVARFSREKRDQGGWANAHAYFRLTHRRASKSRIDPRTIATPVDRRDAFISTPTGRRVQSLSLRTSRTANQAVTNYQDWMALAQRRPGPIGRSCTNPTANCHIIVPRDDQTGRYRLWCRPMAPPLHPQRHAADKSRALPRARAANGWASWSGERFSPVRRAGRDQKFSLSLVRATTGRSLVDRRQASGLCLGSQAAGRRNLRAGAGWQRSCRASEFGIIVGLYSPRLVEATISALVFPTTRAGLS